MDGKSLTKYLCALLLFGLNGVVMGACWMFLYEAYQQLGVGLASLPYYCAPVIVMALSPLPFREKLTAPNMALIIDDILDENYRLEADGNSFAVNGKLIPAFREPDTRKFPWKDLGIDLVIRSLPNQGCRPRKRGVFDGMRHSVRQRGVLRVALPEAL